MPILYKHKFNRISLAALLIASSVTAKATELDAVLARLEKLEAENRAAAVENKKILSENKKIISENAALRDRVNRLEAKEPSTAGNKMQLGDNKRQKFASLDQPKVTPSMPASQDTIQNSKEMTAENSWDGVYGGLNVGYSAGITNGSNTWTKPYQDATNDSLFYYSAQNGNQIYLYQPSTWGITSLVNYGTASVKQNGLLGGIQVGYNSVLGRKYIAGIESDIQGSAITGSGQYSGRPINQSYKSLLQNS